MSMTEYEKLVLIKVHAEAIAAYCAAEMDRSTEDTDPIDRIKIRAERILSIAKP